MRTFPPLYKKTSAGKIQEWTVAVRENADGTGTIVINQGQVDGKKQIYEEQVTEGKNLGKANATTAFAQAVAEAESRWTAKKDRHHYGEDVEANESAEKRALAPMLAQSYDKFMKSNLDWSLAMAQPKLDGNRCTARRETGGKISLWTRKGVAIVTLPHVQEGLSAVMRDGDTFDGEVYVHGMHVTGLRSFLTRAQDGCENVSFRVYDMVTSAPFVERISYLNTLMGDRVVRPRDGIALVETIRVMDEAELMKFQAECIEQGFEGAMLRWGRSGYEAGKRSAGLLKVKTFQDEEFHIVNVLRSEGTFNLRSEDADIAPQHVHVAVFECRTKAGHRFDVTAPGTIAEKRAILDNRENYIGKKVTVKFQNYTKTEAPVPFQPVAKEVRE